MGDLNAPERTSRASRDMFANVPLQREYERLQVVAPIWNAFCARPDDSGRHAIALCRVVDKLAPEQQEQLVDHILAMAPGNQRTSALLELNGVVSELPPSCHDKAIGAMLAPEDLNVRALMFPSLVKAFPSFTEEQRSTIIDRAFQTVISRSQRPHLIEGEARSSPRHVSYADVLEHVLPVMPHMTAERQDQIVDVTVRSDDDDARAAIRVLADALEKLNERQSSKVVRAVIRTDCEFEAHSFAQASLPFLSDEDRDALFEARIGTQDATVFRSLADLIPRLSPKQRDQTIIAADGFIDDDRWEVVYYISMHMESLNGPQLDQLVDAGLALRGAETNRVVNAFETTLSAMTSSQRKMVVGAMCDAYKNNALTDRQVGRAKILSSGDAQVSEAFLHLGRLLGRLAKFQQSQVLDAQFDEEEVYDIESRTIQIKRMVTVLIENLALLSTESKAKVTNAASVFD